MELFMQEDVVNRHKIGIIRAVKGEIPLTEQTAKLIEFGVDEKHIYHVGKDSHEEIASPFHYKPGNDILVVPFLGALGSKFDVLLGLIGKKGAWLHDLESGKEIPCKGWDNFSWVKKGVTMTGTAPGRKASTESPNKSGPKPQPAAFMAKARARWSDPEGTNEDAAQEIGVSNQWMYIQLGARGEAVKKAAEAAERKANK